MVKDLAILGGLGLIYLTMLATIAKLAWIFVHEQPDTVSDAGRHEPLRARGVSNVGWYRASHP